VLKFNELLAEAASAEVRALYGEVIARLEPSVHFPLELYRKLTSDVGFVSVRTVLGAYVRLLRPKNYMEIGTRRGHSVCMVARCATVPLKICCFDAFLPGYAGEPNPGFEHVKKELAKFGCSDAACFVGNSRDTVPEYFENNPDPVELFLVDGDHSAEGARADLLNAIGHVAINGLLVFDDISGNCGVDPRLKTVWLEVMAQHPTFIHYEDTTHENGWAAAIRRA